MTSDRDDVGNGIGTPFTTGDAAFCRRVWKTPAEIYRRRLERIGFIGRDHILDAGCGFGQWTAELARTNRWVTAVDASPARVEATRQALEVLGIENVDIAAHSISGLAYAAETFDAIFCYSVLYLTDARATISELARILRPGGRLYVCSNGPGWYLHLLLSAPNRSRGYNPRRTAVAAFAATARSMTAGRVSDGWQIVVRSGRVARLVDEAGLAVIERGGEGTLGDVSVAVVPFFAGRYYGLEGVYELLASKPACFYVGVSSSRQARLDRVSGVGSHGYDSDPSGTSDTPRGQKIRRYTCRDRRRRPDWGARSRGAQRSHGGGRGQASANERNIEMARRSRRGRSGVRHHRHRAQGHVAAVCGIAGIVSRDGAPIDGAVLRRMTDAIAHRGPDGEGIYADGPIGLGNRRLAILDLSAAGAQPMANDVGDVVLTYNGEIYNFRELRAELERLGRSFRSRGDTEVVLRAYEQWGPSFVERLNGMFAFAIWDARSRKVLLARDRYGIKPLYVTHVGSNLLFASEIKAFLEHPAFRVEASLPHLLEYFTFQNIFSEGTLFRGVSLVPPGSTLTVHSDGSTSARRYWDFRFEEPESSLADEEYLEELDRLFRRAVERQLVSDAPLGAYLSGGMDSGSITAVAAARLPSLSTFTGGFDLTSASGLEMGWDERAKAESMSYLFGTEQYETVLKAGDMERCLPALTWHLEDPRVGQSYPNYYIARLASRFVKVVLSGAGGDELFAGYPWRYYRAVVNDSFDDYVEKYYGFWHRLIPNAVIREFFAPAVWSEIRDIRTIDIFRGVFPEQAAPRTPEDYVNHSLYFEAKTFLQGLLLVDDKLSMAHGLEARVPFLDNDLVDFAQRVPVRLKLRDLDHVVRMDENEPGNKGGRYFDRVHDGKILLRRAMQRHVPSHLTGHAKQGFSGPDATWFRGESLDYVQRQLFGAEAALYEYLDADTVRGLVTEHLEGKVNRRLLIWSLLSFEQWCRTFLRGEAKTA